MSWPTQVVRYRESLPLTISSTLYAGAGVAVSMLLTLPVHLTLLAVANVAAVVTVLFGYMVVSGLTCNPITYTVVLMSLGFCVDYSCHVVHFADYGVKPGTPWDVRVGHSLRECGFDVMQGCTTAFLGVVVLGFNPAVAFRIFAATSVVITGLGGIFALWGLPSILALFGRFFGGARYSHRTAVAQQREGLPAPEIRVVDVEADLESKVEPNLELGVQPTLSERICSKTSSSSPSSKQSTAPPEDDLSEDDSDDDGAEAEVQHPFGYPQADEYPDGLGASPTAAECHPHFAGNFLV